MSLTAANGLTPYHTQWLSQTLPSNCPNRFLWAAFRRFLRALPLFRPFAPYRTPEMVKADYDRQRKAKLAELESMDWEGYISFPQEYMDFILMDDCVFWGPVHTTQTRHLAHLGDVVQQYSTKGATVIEFGSGCGRNLLYLKKRFPEINFIGLEFSSNSVELSRQAARKFGLEVTFYECDVCSPLPPQLPDPGEVQLAFSGDTLEQMPRIYPKAVQNMLASSSKAVVLVEPVAELYPWNLRGVASRLRIRHLDRMRGLLGILRELTTGSDWSIAVAQRLRFAANPLNEDCEIHLLRSPTHRGKA